MRRIAYLLTGLMLAAAASSCAVNETTLLQAVTNPSCMQYFYLGQAAGL
jgi:hypothetical protein